MLILIMLYREHLVKNINVIGVDWGSTNFRAWGFDEEGIVLEETAAAIGLKTMKCSADFEAAFLKVCGAWLSQSPAAKIIFCGMVGARGGWKEAPYALCPLDPIALVNDAIRFKINGHDAIILPGAMTQNFEAADVMRGEEIQILGIALQLCLDDVRFCIPGTHCKWARLQGGNLTDFRTHLTGELFQLLREHSLLGKLAEGDEFNKETFEQGLMRGAVIPLTNAVFATRANILADRLHPEHAASFLSGVLIGSEIAAEPEDDGPLILLASAEHAERYGIALDYFGRTYRLYDSDQATRYGLTLAASKLGMAMAEAAS